MSNFIYCTRCLKRLPEDEFELKADGSRKRICKADRAKAANKQDEVLIPYSDLIEDLVSHELTRSVSISIADPEIDDSLSNLVDITQANLKPLVTDIVNRIGTRQITGLFTIRCRVPRTLYSITSAHKTSQKPRRANTRFGIEK